MFRPNNRFCWAQFSPFETKNDVFLLLLREAVHNFSNAFGVTTCFVPRSPLTSPKNSRGREAGRFLDHRLTIQAQVVVYLTATQNSDRMGEKLTSPRAIGIPMYARIVFGSRFPNRHKLFRMRAGVLSWGNSAGAAVARGEKTEETQRETWKWKVRGASSQASEAVKASHDRFGAMLHLSTCHPCNPQSPRTLSRQSGRTGYRGRCSALLIENNEASRNPFWRDGAELSESYPVLSAPHPSTVPNSGPSGGTCIPRAGFFCHPTYTRCMTKSTLSYLSTQWDFLGEKYRLFNASRTAIKRVPGVST